MPRVSVILPNYNYARYLKERVRSVLQQTVSDLELIYLDDASTDESNQVIEAFAADPRLQRHCYSKNSGRVYQRWNDGANLASGEWLWFAGADDSAHPRFLERLLALAHAHPNAAILHARTAKIDADGRLVSMDWHGTAEEQAHLRQDYAQPGYREIFPLTRANYLFTASSMLLRRDAFQLAGGFDARLWLVADWSLYLTLLHRFDIAYTAEPLSCYRVHRTTVSNSTRATVQAVEAAYCQAQAYLQMQDDARFTDAERREALQRVRLGVFDIFADPAATIPDNLRFAAEMIHRAVPDRRLQLGQMAEV